MPKFELITNTLSYERRIQNRVDVLREEILAGDGAMLHLEDILIAAQSYMADYEDSDIQSACLKVREAIFYLESFNNY